MKHADALSRLRFGESHPAEPDEDIHFLLQSCISLEELQQETEKDTLLCGIIRRVQTGDWKNCTQAEKIYKSNAFNLTIENDCLRFDSRFVAPLSLRAKVIDIAHETHNGIYSTKCTIKIEFW